MTHVSLEPVSSRKLSCWFDDPIRSEIDYSMSAWSNRGSVRLFVGEAGVCLNEKLDRGYFEGLYDLWNFWELNKFKNFRLVVFMLRILVFLVL